MNFRPVSLIVPMFAAPIAFFEGAAQAQSLPVLRAPLAFAQPARTAKRDQATLTIEGLIPAPGTEGGAGFVSCGLEMTAAPASPGTGAATGRVSFKDLNIVRTADDVTTLLFLACLQAKHFKQAVLRTGPFTFTLSDVVVTGQKLSVPGSADEATIETVTLSFARIQVVGPSGKPVTWDLKANRP